ncbi:hypothetical protein MXB_4157 [Myxobolus squamalis]|nr:hypothetical protein MXB_4157 [Myxobolus squamalis]
MNNHLSRVMEQNYNFEQLQMDHSNSSCPCCGSLHKNTANCKIVKHSTLRNIVKKKFAGWKCINNILLKGDKNSRFVLFKCHFCTKFVSIELRFASNKMSEKHSIMDLSNCKVEKKSIDVANSMPLKIRMNSKDFVPLYQNIDNVPPSHSKKKNLKKSNGLSAFLSTLDTNF